MNLYYSYNNYIYFSSFINLYKYLIYSLKSYHLFIVFTCYLSLIYYLYKKKKIKKKWNERKGLGERKGNDSFGGEVGI